MSYRTTMARTAATAYIETFTGKKFYPLWPIQEGIDIVDIAHALSNVCRYTGHCHYFYSVAEHCVRMSGVVPHEFKMEALLHDASEAYLADIAGPIKPFLPDYLKAERRLEVAIRRKFGLPDEMSPEVKEADRRILVTEARDLGMSWWEEWRDRGILPYDFEVIPFESNERVCDMFLNEFYNLGGQR